MNNRNKPSKDKTKKDLHHHVLQWLDQKHAEHLKQHADRFNKSQAKTQANQTKIIQAALEILDQKGLDDLSIRDIAHRIHRQGPAIYWYFKNKETLVDFMAEAILAEAFSNLTPRAEHEDWQDWLIAQMQTLRQAMLSRTDGARVVAGAHFYPAITLAKLYETAFISLTSANLDLKTARHIILTTTYFTFGFCIEEQAAPTPEELAAAKTQEIRTMFPNLFTAVDQAAQPLNSGDQDFLTGLQFIINGAPKA